MTSDELKFIQQLIVGSYAFTAGCYAFGFFILKALGRIEKALIHDRAKQDGLELGKRVTRLERLINTTPRDRTYNE